MIATYYIYGFQPGMVVEAYSGGLVNCRLGNIPINSKGIGHRSVSR